MDNAHPQFGRCVIVDSSVTARKELEASVRHLALFERIDEAPSLHEVIRVAATGTVDVCLFGSHLDSNKLISLLTQLADPKDGGPGVVVIRQLSDAEKAVVFEAAGAHFVLIEPCSPRVLHAALVDAARLGGVLHGTGHARDTEEVSAASITTTIQEAEITHEILKTEISDLHNIRTRLDSDIRELDFGSASTVRPQTILNQQRISIASSHHEPQDSYQVPRLPDLLLGTARDLRALSQLSGAAEYSSKDRGTLSPKLKKLLEAIFQRLLGIESSSTKRPKFDLALARIAAEWFEDRLRMSDADARENFRKKLVQAAKSSQK
ncbi:MAG: hypothetical protein KDD44_08825 [Bdellovibrionales bacterium]|nr:hypothetical protein [Bdellovibrionales bacterium]